MSSVPFTVKSPVWRVVSSLTVVPVVIVMVSPAPGTQAQSHVAVLLQSPVCTLATVAAWMCPEHTVAIKSTGSANHLLNRGFVFIVLPFTKQCGKTAAKTDMRLKKFRFPRRDGVTFFHEESGNASPSRTAPRCHPNPEGLE